MNPDTTAPPVIEVAGLTKTFRDFWRRPKVQALRGIDLEVRPGEVFGLLGPNGSGKSTTIKILLGLLHATSGEVRVFGDSPRRVHTKRLLGYLPEDSYLYSYLTARETLDFFGRLFGMPRAGRRARADELLELVSLTAAADRPVGEYSKGMARRLGLAQAMINDPRLLILDEPTAGLDPIGCRQVKDLMLSLAAQGKTIVLCSHLLADVEDVCDRIAILHAGSIRARGRVSELLRRAGLLTITLDDPAEDARRELIEFAQRRTGAEVRVEHPSMSLEQYFLEIVGQAHAGCASPSVESAAGAGAGEAPRRTQ